MPCVSVIVPVYKVENTLKQCVNSIISQTYTDIEIILVDDGSPDKCPDICDELKNVDARIKVVHKENGGLSSARNTGLDIMTGEYVTFVDSDDIIHPEMIQRLYSAVTEGKSDVSVCRSKTFEDDAQISFDELKTDLEVKGAAELLEGGSMYRRAEAWGKLYERKIFSSVRFKEGIYYEDTHIFPYILNRAKSVAFVEDKLYFYRRVEGCGIMNSPLSAKKLVVLDIYLEHSKFYKRLGVKWARRILLELLVGSAAKGSIICRKKGLRGNFYCKLFKILPTVLFCSPKALSLKNRIMFLTTFLPSKLFKNIYISKYGHVIDFNVTDNL